MGSWLRRDVALLSLAQQVLWHKMIFVQAKGCSLALKTAGSKLSAGSCSKTGKLNLPRKLASSTEVGRIQKEQRCASAIQQERDGRPDNQPFDDAGPVSLFVKEDKRDDIRQLCQADGDERDAHADGCERNLN